MFGLTIFTKEFWEGIFSNITKMSMPKILLVSACLVFGYLTVYMKDEIKEYIFPIQEATQTGKPTDFSLPTSVSAEDRSYIKADLNKLLRKNRMVGALFVYEFQPRGNEILYQGRVIVSEAGSEEDLAARYNQKWMTMVSDKYEVHAMLNGNAFHRDLTTIDISSDSDQFTSVNMRLVVQDGFQYMVSVPVIDEQLHVRGYISAYLVDVPTEKELNSVIEDLEYEANELSRYL